MLAVIKYTTMLEKMEAIDRDGNPIPFSVTFISFNRFFFNKVKRELSANQKSTLIEVVAKLLKQLPESERVGIIKNYENVVLARNMKSISNTSAAREPIVTARENLPKQLRSSIRRLYLPDQLKIKSCYTRLIINFNGNPVIY
jgi:hypothetical protein